MDNEFQVDIVRSVTDIQNDSILCVGDTHHGNQDDTGKLAERSMIKYVIKHPKDKVFMNGDIFDCSQVSNHPSSEVTSIEEEINETTKILKPIYSQINAICWGNHDERIFREPFGKGVASNILYGHFSIAQSIKEKNPDLTYAPLMKGINMQIHTQKRDYELLLKHGRRAGGNAHFGEFEEVMGVHNNLDIIAMGHTHRPFISPRCSIDPEGKAKVTWFVRTGAFTSWLPYQDKMNLPPTPPAFIEIPFENGVMKQPIIRMF